jgi:hypothetical protein
MRRPSRTVAALIAAVLLVQLAASPPAEAGIGSIGKVLGPALTQIVKVIKPALTKLRYGYCNALSCGTSENLECVGNLFIPGFLGDITRNVTIAAPAAGATVEELQIAHGSTTPTDFASGAVGGAGGSRLFGGISVVLRNVGQQLSQLQMKVPISNLLRQALRDTSGLSGEEADKQVTCGVPEEQKNEVTTAHPDGSNGGSPTPRDAPPSVPASSCRTSTSTEATPRSPHRRRHRSPSRTATTTVRARSPRTT